MREAIGAEVLEQIQALASGDVPVPALLVKIKPGVRQSDCKNWPNKALSRPRSSPLGMRQCRRPWWWEGNPA